MTKVMPAGWAIVAVITAGFAIVAWSGVEQYKSSGGDDEVAYRSYVSELDALHRLPTPAENAEYSVPPGIPALGVALDRAFAPIRPDQPSPILQGLPRLLRRLLWLALVAGGAVLIARAPPLAPRWLIGVGAWLAAAGWAWAYVSAAVDNQAWLPLVLIDYVSAVGLVVVSAWLAHELFPDARWAAPIGALGAALLPPVFAASLYFHPDPPFALIAATATALVLRAVRTGLTVRAGVVAGSALGVGGLTRQSAPLIVVVLLGGVVLIARRDAWRYVTAATLVTLAIAGPWWLHQIQVYGNPVQSNLNRPGRMLDHQPRSFYVSFPTTLVTHPQVPNFENELLPRIHAYLWADWNGGYHGLWESPKRYARTLASVQSVLGFGGDALVLGGLVLLGVPALLRVLRRTASGNDGPLALLTLLFVLAWAAYVVTLVRFPQRDGDPIKVHYVLFLGPVSIALAVAAGRAFARRGRWPSALLAAWLAVYGLSWALTLFTAF